MDEKLNTLLNDILDGATDALASANAEFFDKRNVDEYINRLCKITDIVMSAKAGLLLSNQSAFAEVPDFSKEECT